MRSEIIKEIIMNLFTKTIEGWASWAKVFQSIQAFEPLIRQILHNHDLPLGPSVPIEQLPPGTNAVFKVGHYVVKIYAPEESGISDNGSLSEIRLTRLAERRGVPVPQILASGLLTDRYQFEYMVTRWMNGPMAGDVLPGYSSNEKCNFALKIKEIAERINRPEPDAPLLENLIQRAVANPRLEGLPRSLIEDMAGLAQSREMDGSVWVHGDITGENILLVDGQPVVIDFGDSIGAPAAYELPPLVFDLFRCDPEMVQAFLDGGDRESFLDDLIFGLSIHDFGASILKDYCRGQGFPRDHYKSLKQLRSELSALLF